MKITICDMCGKIISNQKARDEIDYTEYDLCSDCRALITEKMLNNQIVNFEDEVGKAILQVAHQTKKDGEEKC